MGRITYELNPVQKRFIKVAVKHCAKNGRFLFDFGLEDARLELEDLAQMLDEALDSINLTHL